MKRALLALSLLIAGFLGMGAQAKFQRVIYVTNDSTVLSNAAVADSLTAIQTAIDKDFAPVWHEDAVLIFIGHQEPPKGSWHIDIVDTPPCAWCAGFHDFTADGDVEAFVGADLEGMNWQVTFTHELFEMLADPWAANDGSGARTVKVGEDRYIVEVGDPVEAEKFAYYRSSASGKPVLISDFVTPAWFRAGSKGLWDFTHSCKRPLQILPEGYQLVIRGGQIVSLS